MADPKAYETKAGTRYSIQYRTPDRKPTTKRGFKTKRAAKEWLQDYLTDSRRGVALAPTAGRITVADYGTQWLDSRQRLAPKTKAGYEYAIDLMGRYGLGGLHLRDVTPELIEKWIQAMQADLSPKTISTTYAVLQPMMTRAVRDKHIIASPCVDIELPKIVKKDPVFLTAAQVLDMADAAGAYSGYVKALAMTGMRWGEFAGLQVQDVDLDAGEIRIVRQVTEVRGRLTHGEPKHDRRRRIGVMAPLRHVLASQTAGKAPDSLVFPTLSGTVLRVRNARRGWFDPAAEAIGMSKLTPHDMRHTFASLAISSGANPKALQTTMGHSTVSTTMDIYGHIFPDDALSFVNQMGHLFTRAGSQNAVKKG